LDKYEYKVKLAQIEKLVAKKDFVTAAKIADGIDWRKVKSVTTLNMIADIYEANERLEDCYEILNMVYDRSPIGRRVVYRMTEVATKMHDFEEAIDLYKEFVKIAPHDLGRYILKYQIYRERGSSVTDQITILEEYKSHEYDERWSYELACLYEEAGQIEQCVEECDELILWFSEGEFVAKAMELKMKYQELTASQLEKFEHRYDYMTEEADSFEEETENEEIEENKEVVKTAEPVEEEAEEEDDTPKVSVINTNKFSTMNLQEELAKGLQMILAQEEELEKEQEEEPKPDTQEFIPVKEVVIPREEPVTEEEPAAEEEPVTEEEPVAEEEPVLEEATALETKKPLSETAELKTELLKYAAIPQERKMEEFLRTEDDGQITLAIGEENVLEKQITGQMTIEEILEAWEEKKRQARAQMEKSGDRREAVLYETGEITGLLEDFIPRTPKEVQELMEEIETETEPATEEITLEEVVVEAEAETEEQSVEETAMEEPVAEETAEEEVVEEETVTETIEDDLPMDIDFAEALEAALEESEEKEEKTETSVSQNTASMLDAIERALAMEAAPVETAGNYMTEEQEKIFAYFTSVDGMKKQLVNLLAEDSIYASQEDSNTGNLIITGHPGNGKTTLAIDIVKAFQKQRKQKAVSLQK
jgi:adenylate kinase family enzyme